jgi:hypothetical protein
MAARRIRFNVYLGLMALAGSAALLVAGLPFMKIWFYCFAWWSFLLALDGLNFRRSGASYLFGRPSDFLVSALLSVSVWLVFELFNFRLKNWSYHGLPESGPVRWAGYVLGFATVIPALKILTAFIHGLLKNKRWTVRRLAVTPALLDLGLGLGLGFLLAALAWPRLFFPLVWLGFFFLIEPLNYRRRRPSVLRDLEEGDATRAAAWMLAGLAAGIIWEAFNFWAGSHWEYHIPYLNFGRVFQMPVFGFGGFPPFALEIFAIDALARGFYGGIKSKPTVRIAFWVVLIGFDLAGFYLIDMMSVVQ